MNTQIEYKKGILFIKISGVLVGNKINKFESEVIPIVLGLQAGNITINMNDISLIDKRGINSLIKISNLSNKFNGKLVLCNLNDYLKSNFKHSDIFDYCFKSKNEKSSVEVFKIWWMKSILELRNASL